MLLSAMRFVKGANELLRMKSVNPLLLVGAVSAIKAPVALFFIFFAPTFWGGDGNTFDAYALGLRNDVAGIWPDLLRFLHSVGLYNRFAVTMVLCLLGFFVIPYLTARISSLPSSTQASQRVFWCAFLLMALYPTLFFYSLDIFRDVFMIFCFLLAVWSIEEYFESEKIVSWRSFVLVAFFFSMCFFLFLLRDYLGFSLFAAFFACLFFSFSRHSLLVWSAVALVGLWVLFAMGLLSPLLAYRSGFWEYMFAANSNLNIRFDSVPFFLFDLSKSVLYQLFGLFFVNISSVAVFLLESVPFTYGLVYLVRNRCYSDLFVDFLLSFFFIYNSIWIIANDNLGTAVRLRMFGYIAVLISCMIVYQRKMAEQDSEEAFSLPPS